MKKQSVLFVLTMVVLAAICSCTLLVKPLDNNMRFSEQLSKLERDIRNKSWEQAGENLKAVKKVWKSLKPWLQVDIDHDYVYEIEENLAKLEAYIETKDQPEALANLLMIQKTWEDIESL